MRGNFTVVYKGIIVSIIQAVVIAVILKTGKILNTYICPGVRMRAG